jgi:hypothetical protein
MHCDPCQAVALLPNIGGARCPTGEALRTAAVELGIANAAAVEQARRHLAGES